MSNRLGIGLGTNLANSVGSASPATAPSQFGTGEWSVSDNETGGDITITILSLPYNGASAITDLEYQLDGGSWVSMGDDATGDYQVTGLTDDVEYDVAVRAVNGVGNGTASATKAVTPTLSDIDPEIAWKGWHEDYDNGTTYDYLVASDGSGSHGGIYTTWQAGLNAAVAAGGSKIVMVKDCGVKYRSTAIALLNFGNANNIQFLGYSTHKPTGTTFKVLTPGTLCSGADADIVGNLTGRPIRKTTIANSTYDLASCVDLNLYEAGAHMPFSQDRADKTNMFIPDNYTTYHVADSVTTKLIGVNYYWDTITDVAVFSQYTEAQMLKAHVYLLAYPNTIVRAPISAYNSTTNTVTVSGNVRSGDGTAAPGAGHRYFNLVQIGPAIELGQWIAIDNGDSTTTIYYWPIDSGAEIEYTTFDCVVGISASDNILFRGFKIEGAAAVGDNAPNPTYHGGGIATHKNNATYKDNWTISNVHLSKFYRACAIQTSRTSNVTIEYCTVQDVSDWFGVNLAGEGLGLCFNGFIRNCHFSNMSRAPIRIQGLDTCIISYNYIERCGTGAHANKFNFYPPMSSKALFWGVVCGPDAYGYVTYQEASAICGGMSIISAGTDGRTYVDQNGSTVPDSGTLENYNTNLVLLPLTNGQTKNCVVLGDAVNGLNFSIINSVFNGSIFEPGSKTEENNNVITFDDGVQDYGADDVFENDYDVIFTDIFNQDFTVTSDSPLIDMPASVNTAATFAALQALFPAFEHFNKDIYGREFSEYFVGVDSTVVDAIPADVTAPVLTLPTASASGPTTAALGVTTDSEDGTLYVVVTTSATPPSAAQIILGQNNSGTAAVFADDQAIASSGIKTFTATGLTASTNYYTYFTHADAALNISNVSSASMFTTTSSTLSMSTIIMLTGDDATEPSNSAVRYASFGSGTQGANWVTTSASAEHTIPVAGTFHNLRVFLTVAPGAGTWTFQLMVNGSAVGSTLAMTGATVEDVLATTGVTIAAEDTVCLRCTPSTTPTAAAVHIGLEFRCTTSATPSGLLLGPNGTTATASGQTFNQFGQSRNWQTVESAVTHVMPTAGVIDKFRVRIGVAPGSGVTRTFRLYKNGSPSGVTVALTGTGTGNNITFAADITNTASYAAGDTMSIEQTISGGTAPTASGKFTARWIPTIPGESLLFSEPFNGLVADSYLPLNGCDNAGGDATEVGMHNIAPVAFTLKKAYGILNSVPGVGKTRVITAYKEGSSTSLVMTFGAADATTNDITHDVSVAAGDTLSWRNAVTGSPTASIGLWSAVAFVTPV